MAFVAGFVRVEKRDGPERECCGGDVTTAVEADAVEGCWLPETEEKEDVAFN